MRVVYLPSANTRPIAMPATGALIGTPASISDSVEPQTDAIDVEPFDDSTSETTRIVYGHSLRVREHRDERPLGERAVTDLAALRRADPSGLARWRTAGSCSGACSACARRCGSCRASAPCAACRASRPRAPASRPAGTGRSRARWRSRRPRPRAAGCRRAAPVDADALVDDALADDFLLQRTERLLHLDRRDPANGPGESAVPTSFSTTCASISCEPRVAVVLSAIFIASSTSLRAPPRRRRRRRAS